MKKLLTIISLILICVLIQPSFVVSENTGGNKAEVDALNQQIAEKKEKIKQLEASISEYKKQIEVKKSEAVSLSNQIAILDN
ncbi:MAG: hypothetical protein HYV41_01030, partial [Candidatus Magasanikbacteria bacterium]|nr:hypothetical protein [Candidatus Magasanikbacteria bacterium]